MSEFYNKARRRRMKPEVRARDLQRRARARRKFVQYAPAPLTPDDTVRLVAEEQEVVDYIRSSGSAWVKMWGMLNALTRTGHVALTRPRRQVLMAVVNRMLREKKLIRHRKTQTIALAPTHEKT